MAWTQVLCGKISLFNSAQEMCESLNKLTSYQENKSGGILALKYEGGKAVFDRREQCALLQSVFFFLVENILMNVRLKSISERRWKGQYKIMRRYNRKRAEKN